MQLDQHTADLLRNMYGIDRADMVSLPDSLLAAYDHVSDKLRRTTRQGRPDSGMLVMIASVWEMIHPDDHKKFVADIHLEQQGEPAQEAPAPQSEPKSEPVAATPVAAAPKQYTYMEAWVSVPEGTPIVANFNGEERTGTYYKLPWTNRDKEAERVLVKLDNDEGAQFRKIPNADVRIAEPVSA